MVISFDMKFKCMIGTKSNMCGGEREGGQTLFMGIILRGDFFQDLNNTLLLCGGGQYKLRDTTTHCCWTVMNYFRGSTNIPVTLGQALVNDRWH